MSDSTIRLLAGECTVRVTDSGGVHEERGRVVTVVKPDDTVLVHDGDGYRPVAWLTRAEAVTWIDGNSPTVEAVDGERRLRVTCHEEYGAGRYPTSAVGSTVGSCPTCESPLVDAGDRVSCLGCGAVRRIPRDATVLERPCSDCGWPRMRVERGTAIDACVDRDCQPIDEIVRERFDREWSCPECDGDLRILRRGGLIAGCEAYPNCETGFAIPTGVVGGTCECGLPTFDTAAGRRCLDAGCEA